MIPRDKESLDSWSQEGVEGMGHPLWASSALQCGRNQSQPCLPSPAWWHSTSREMAWMGLAAWRSWHHQPDVPAAGERRAGDSGQSSVGRCPSRAGRAELAWLPQCQHQVLVGDGIITFPHPGAEKMCHDTHQHQWGAFRERAGGL